MGLPQDSLCLLHMSPSYLLPSLPHQEGVVHQPEFGCPVERHNKVPHDHIVRRAIFPCGPSWVVEGDPGLFDCKNGDRPPGYLCRGTLK